MLGHSFYHNTNSGLLVGSPVRFLSGARRLGPTQEEGEDEGFRCYLVNAARDANASR